MKPIKKQALIALSLSLLPLFTSTTVISLAILYQNTLFGFDIWQWVILYFLFAITMAFALTPTTFIAILGGYFLGWQSLALMIPAYLIASFLCFRFAQLVDKGKVANKLRDKPKVKRFIDSAHENELLLTISSKVSPILPFALSNFLLASIPVSFYNFLLGSFLGMLPRTALACWAGMKLFILQEELGATSWDWESKLILAILVLMGIIGFFKVFWKRRDR